MPVFAIDLHYLGLFPEIHSGFTHLYLIQARGYHVRVAKPGLIGKSSIFLLLGSGLIWLPAVNQLADGNHGPDTTLLITSILANFGLLALIGLNFWLNRPRKP